MRNISKGIKIPVFLLDISSNISYFLYYILYFLFETIYVSNGNLLSFLIKNKNQLPISNGFLTVTRDISKCINIFRFLQDISHNIYHFTYILTDFHGSREKFSLGQKQRNQLQLDNANTFVATAIKKYIFFLLPLWFLRLSVRWVL